MVKVKICGLTSPSEAEIACDMGADMIGVIVMVNVSTPREVDLGRAGEILEAVPEGTETVVVTMPETLDEVRKVAGELDTDYIQIHNSSSRNDLWEIGKVTERNLIGVVRVPQETRQLEEVIKRARDIARGSDFVLLDTGYGSGGGTGKTHDWGTSRAVLEFLDKPVILAGGLNPSNVQRAVDEVNPYAVDVASGVESEPGNKDPELIKEFIRNSGG